MPVRILHNAKIYTLDQNTPVASAIAIESHQDNRRILAIGDNDTILSEFDGRGIFQNLDGKTIIPGLIDAHIHLKQYSQSLTIIDCEVSTKEECLNRVAERSRKIQPGEWILGHGWNQNEWENGFGNASDLDQVTPYHPVYLTSKSLHAAWVNSIALKISGIYGGTTDIPSGTIQRDKRGRPTGILLENASELVEKYIPDLTQDELINSISNAQMELLKIGITSVHDFDQQDCFKALQHLKADGRLRIRVIKSIPLDLLPNAIELGIHSSFGDDWLRIGSVKMFTDGALGPHTAAMLQPYDLSPDNYGMLLMDSNEIYEHGHKAVSNGLSLAVHAIGDRANREALNAFEALRQLEGKLRHRIEHVQLLHPDDIPRLSNLNIIASMQPIHATSDMQMVDRFWGDRAVYSYGFKTQFTHGARVAFGSDAPVESPNPFWGIRAAVTRQRTDGSPDSEGWNPLERLSTLEALRGFTIGGAYAAGMEDRQGKLMPGYFADLLVLDTNIMECDPSNIDNIRPIATMVGGEWITDPP